MKKLFLLFTSLALVSFTSCKENASEKINQENVTKAAERDAQTIVYPSVTFDKVAHDFGEIQNGTGDLINRISEDVGKVRMYVGPALMYTINMITLFVVALIYMYSKAPTLTLYTVIPLPILSFSIY